MDILFLALVAHDKARIQSHVFKHLVQVPSHAEAGSAAHPGVYIVLKTVVQFLRGSRTPRGFQTDNLRQVLVGNFGQLVADVLNLFPLFGEHAAKIENDAD